MAKGLFIIVVVLALSARIQAGNDFLDKEPETDVDMYEPDSSSLHFQTFTMEDEAALNMMVRMRDLFPTEVSIEVVTQLIS